MSSGSNGTTVHFVNHASYIQTYGTTKLLVDPWTEGSAFFHGWSLLAPTKTPLATLADVTHIWISHEHPDHFVPAFLRTIPEERRRQITVLYQTTRDRKVIDFVSGLGFRTIELVNETWLTIGEGFEVLSSEVPIGDALLVTRCGDATLVNLNDCAHLRDADLKRIRQLAGKIDVVFTQFGYASSQGAPEETELRRALAAAQLDRVTKQVRGLAPKYVIPFASFSYFSAPENAYMNDANNRVSDAVRHLQGLGVEPVVLYPADEWTVRAPHDNAPALERWEAHYGDRSVQHETKPVPVAELEGLAEGYIARMLAFHSPRLVRALHAVRVGGLFGPVDIYLLDHERAVRFSIADGLRPSSVGRSECSLALSSEMLAFIFRFDYGLNTLIVNGRFIADGPGFRRLVRAFALGSLKNEGRRLRPGIVTDRAVWVAASRAVFQRKS